MNNVSNKGSTYNPQQSIAIVIYLILGAIHVISLLDQTQQ